MCKSSCRNIIIILLLIIGQPAQLRCEMPKQSIIAVIDGIPVTDHDITVSNETEYEAFKLKHKRLPDAEELANAVMTAKKQKLIDKIRKFIKERYLKAHGITITPEDVRAEFENIYPGLKKDPEAVLERERSYFQMLYLAVKEASENPNKEREIFESKIKNYMGYQAWQSIFKYYNTPEKMEMLKKMVPESIETIYKSSELSMKGWVLNKKFEDLISKDTVVTEEEIKQLYESEMAREKVKPDFQKVKPDIQQKLLKIKRDQRIKDWWLEQYRKAKIDIKDNRFKDVLEMLGER